MLGLGSTSSAQTPAWQGTGSPRTGSWGPGTLTSGHWALNPSLCFRTRSGGQCELWEAGLQLGQALFECVDQGGHRRFVAEAALQHQGFA